MNDHYEEELRRTQELFDFLQGTVPEGYKIDPAHVPHLTPDQAWTTIWYLGNQFWQVPDYVDRCDVCGDLYHTHCDGDCLDYGDEPFMFCGDCMNRQEYEVKAAKKP